ncbi:MAG: SLC13 family permease [Vicinamibacteria bacterium]
MSVALLSIIAFAVAILLSCFTPINVGLISIAFAFLVGVLFGGMRVAEVASGFPSSLFLVLVGVTLLFSQARVNGTLDQIAKRSVQLARGNPGVIPLVFFFLAMVLASIGPGNIAAVAMLAPIAMSIAGEARISAFLMTVMVATGANCGALSPFAPTGIIANGQLARIGITGAEWPTFINNFVAQSFVGISGYFILGGVGLLARGGTTSVSAEVEPWSWRQKITIALIAGWILSVFFFKVDVGMGAFVAAAFLTLSRAADEEQAVKLLPWNTIIMVSGVTVLISILEKTGGMDLFTGLLTRFSTPESITGVIAFVTGVISVYSSSSGVVLPAFLPTIPGLIEKLGGGDPMAIAASITVGSHLVDVSPLSTLGALCIAAAPLQENRTVLFNKLLLWGLSMSVVGAVVCYVFFGVLGI